MEARGFLNELLILTMNEIEDGIYLAWKGLAVEYHSTKRTSAK